MTYFIKVAMLLCAVIVLLSALSFKTVAARAIITSGRISQNRFSSSTCAWNVVPSPNGATGAGSLFGDAVVSLNDVWAVGTSGSDFSGYFTLIEQWNGKRWQVVSSPNPDPLSNGLFAVSATSASDAWAVGYYNSQTLTEHWNGSKWSVVSSPSPGSIANELRGVIDISTNNVWAVGYTTSSINTQTTLIEHWNGSSWSIVKSPNPGPSPINDVLSGVTALSANNVWAVGAVGDYGGYGQTLIEHWNGSSWSVVKSPNNSLDDVLQGVSAVSASDVWAVGSNGQTQVEQWNGTQWNIIPSPNASNYGNELSGVSALSPDDVWVVGSYDSNGVYNLALTEHWNGTSWSIVTSPTTKQTFLSAVAALSSTDVWAVGQANAYTLTENYRC